MSAPLDQTAEIAQALSHPARLRLLLLLREGALCTWQIAAVLGLSASALSAHLGELRRVGLLRAHRKGRYRSYAVSRTPQAGCWLRLAARGASRDPLVAIDHDLSRRVRALSVEEFAASRSSVADLPRAAAEPSHALN